ncbi:MAG: acyl-CoA dehydratase activase [Dehalococcoidales bacterium]|nr:acyl-CoA dehydratase activase [Dehalococcoidales bacterium]
MPIIVAGVDVGSVATKVVLLDVGIGEEGIPSFTIKSSSVKQSGAAFLKAAEDALDEALDLAGLTSKDIRYTISTGYGRQIVPFADKQVTEISCHARGAKYLFPDVHTIIDIGGQDSKAIRVDDKGGVSNFIMNDKCAAGTGRFLEVMARALGVKLQELGTLSFQSKNNIEVSSMCTVFAESEVISYLSKGFDKSDVAAAIHNSIARRVAGMVGQLGLVERVSMTGGVAKNPGVVRSLEMKLGITLLLPEEPQIMGALGAALIAAGQISTDGVSSEVAGSKA